MMSNLRVYSPEEEALSSPSSFALLPTKSIISISVTVSKSLEPYRDYEMEYVIVFEVRGSDSGVTQLLAFKDGKISVGAGSTDEEFTWASPSDVGVYEIRSFLLSNIDVNPAILSPILMKEVTIVEGRGTGSSMPKQNVGAQQSIENINAKIQDAFKTLVEAESYGQQGKFEEKRNKAVESKLRIAEANEIFQEGKLTFSWGQGSAMEDYIALHGQLMSLAIKEAELQLEAQSILSEIELAKEDPAISEDSIDFAGKLSEYELFVRSLSEYAKDLKNFVADMKAVQSKHPELQIRDQDVDLWAQLAVNWNEISYMASEEIEQLHELFPEGYVPMIDRVIPADQNVTTSTLIPNDLASLFDSFDVNHDKSLTFGEAQNFYYWVEKNIKYRYDDEKLVNPVQGFAVGDGRLGYDYRQSPLETISELAGDCEDMATLEQAFYNYFGIEAYVIGVNATSVDYIDHAATAIRIADNATSFKILAGAVVSYEIAENSTDFYENPMSPGLYMLVDNAYSNVYGDLTGGLQLGSFTVMCTVPLEQGYGGEWYRIVRQCGVPMD